MSGHGHALAALPLDKEPVLAVYYKAECALDPV